MRLSIEADPRQLEETYFSGVAPKFDRLCLLDTNDNAALPLLFIMNF